MNLKVDIEYIKRRQKRLMEYLFFIESLQEVGLEEIDCSKIIVYESYVVIEIDSFLQLNEARKFLKNYFGSWSDSIRSIDNPFDDIAYIRYYREYGKNEKQEEIRLIEIWYKTTIDNIPDEVKANSDCKFVKQIRTEMVYVCPTKEANSENNK